MFRYRKIGQKYDFWTNIWLKHDTTPPRYLYLSFPNPPRPVPSFGLLFLKIGIESRNYTYKVSYSLSESGPKKSMGKYMFLPVKIPLPYDTKIPLVKSFILG